MLRLDFSFRTLFVVIFLLFIGVVRNNFLMLVRVVVIHFFLPFFFKCMFDV